MLAQKPALSCVESRKLIIVIMTIGPEQALFSDLHPQFVEWAKV